MNRVPVLTVRTVTAALRRHADPRHAAALRRFFKTAPGEYGAGDRFLGIKVPQIRSTAKACRALALPGIMQLLQSPFHEERLLALLLMVEQYDKGDTAARAAIFSGYLGNTRWINNWDLVDLSAPQIVGQHLTDKDRGLLKKLAVSHNLWERRMAILASFWFIKQNDYHDALAIAELLVQDRHDLIHKAVGWMLREIGKRDRAAEEQFLKKHAATMPRTMLRYAIERFPEKLRQTYLKARTPSSRKPLP